MSKVKKVKKVKKHRKPVRKSGPGSLARKKPSPDSGGGVGNE